MAESLLGYAVGGDVGGVEEVDAGVNGKFDEFVGAGFIDLADFESESASAVEGHGAEAEGGDEQAGVAEGLYSMTFSWAERVGVSVGRVVGVGDSGSDGGG